ncbi:unnamed protein product [Durusdinium trenchii]|uniref:Uncharacterized protein n=1 Tax=Durusdinium trenchii TaxID=1381693 RepID=A0ABP0KH69_9DINO
MAAFFLIAAVPFLVAADSRPDTLSSIAETATARNLGYKPTECTGEGSMPTVTDTPLCWGGDLLVQTFNIKVNSYDGTSGTVDMEMRGPTSGQCTETPFENNNNEISLGEQHECSLGDSEYTVKYCPDQDKFVINIVKPWTVEVTLKRQECGAADERKKEILP